MANKYQLITELYRTTLLSVTETPQAWKAFLRSACNSYKCPFDEQVLIYAQKPEATAVLEMEKWNTFFGRWVNKGATGIAVFEEKNGRSGLKYYFDVTDTHESRYAKPVPVWQMEQAFETSVAESLENSFGTLAEKESFPQAVLSAGKNLMADNIADYLAEIVNTTADVEIVDRFPKLVENSISYMALSRMGVSADEYIPDSVFAGIERFDSVRKINCLNCFSASTAYSEMQRTKEKWHKTGGVLGYHFIQSFKPKEATPETVHEIGVEFARRCFGERFEVVIGTHLDRNHLHNHIVVNSVSFADGKKYHSNAKSYFVDIRKISDEICREYGLSVIEPQKKGI